MTRSAKPSGVAPWLCLFVVWILESGCVLSRSPSGLPIARPVPNPSSLSVGEWKGSTSQGRSITFIVSKDGENVTSLMVGYDFNGCSGTREFLQLDIPTKPDVTCIPGPCSGTAVSYRGFGFSDATSANRPYTQVNGVFLPGNLAKGQAIFSGYPDCGSATVEWTATRR